MANMHVLAPYEEFIGIDGLSYWDAPGGNAVGGYLDLRTIPQSSLIGGAPQGFGLFSYDTPQVIAGAIDLGSDIQGSVSLANRQGLEQALSLAPGAIKSTQLDGIIAELFTNHADPTGLTQFKPIRGSIRIGTQIHFGDFGKILDEPLSSTVRDNAIAVFQADYRRSVVDGLPDVALRKWTGATMLSLWGRMSDDNAGALLPPEFIGKGYERPTTTVGDTFVEASDTALESHTATGPNSGFSWVKVVAAASKGTIDAASNQLFRASAGGGSTTAWRADSALSSSDNSAELGTIDTSDTNVSVVGTLMRMHATDHTDYFIRFSFTEDTIEFYKIIDDSSTKLGSSVAYTMTSGTPFKGSGEIIDTTLEAFADDVSKGTRTDTGITSGLYTGMVFFKATAGNLILDDFEGKDLAAAARRIFVVA